MIFVVIIGLLIIGQIILMKASIQNIAKETLCIPYYKRENSMVYTFVLQYF